MVVVLLRCDGSTGGGVVGSWCGSDGSMVVVVGMEVLW